MRLVTLLTVIAACTTPNKAEEVLLQQGYTDIETKGYAPFACSEDDTFATRFTARAPNGEDVSGAVCCGVLKRCTVRL